MIKRKTAEQYLDLIRKQAELVNAGDYAYTVVRLEVFGSYLTDKEVLGDFDLMVTLAPRYESFAEQEAYKLQRRKAAIKAGRNFSTYVDELYWPIEEVHRVIKNGKRGISLHTSDEREGLLKHGATFKEFWPLDI